MNNALRQAGYTGTPYPEARELEDYTEEEMEEYYKQEAVARRVIVQAAIQDPGFLRRLREALGLDVSKIYRFIDRYHNRNPLH